MTFDTENLNEPESPIEREDRLDQEYYARLGRAEAAKEDEKSVSENEPYHKADWGVGYSTVIEREGDIDVLRRILKQVEAYERSYADRLHYGDYEGAQTDKLSAIKHRTEFNQHLSNIQL